MEKSLTMLQIATIWEKYFSTDTKNLFNLKREVKNTKLRHSNKFMLLYDGENIIQCQGAQQYNLVNHAFKNNIKKFVIFNNCTKLFTVYDKDCVIQDGLLQLKQSVLYNYLYQTLSKKLNNKFIESAKEKLVNYNKKYNTRKEVKSIIVLWKRAFKDTLVPLYKYRIDEAGEREYLLSQYTLKDKGKTIILQAHYEGGVA